jgi:glycosyltransferase involved in cell wall biosynthesis
VDWLLPQETGIMCEISVIIPLYNKGAYIGRALDSVFAQTFQDYEVIVIDDGSTDDGPERVASYTDERLHLIRQANAGPGAARNRGIREAKGKYVAFLDADDEWLPEYLMKSYTVLEQHKECDFSVSGWYQDYSQSLGNERNVNIVEIYRDLFNKSLGGIWEITSKMSDHTLANAIHLFHTNTVLIKTSVARKYNGFLEGYNYGEDMYLWILLMFNHKFYYIDSPLAWYHDAVSDLGGEFWKKPLHAFFLFSDKIYIQSENKNLVRRWFSLKALQESHNRLSAGKIEDTRYLMATFPYMKWVEPWSFIKLIIKFKLPFLRKKTVYN